jgi:hypothetical protein
MPMYTEDKLIDFDVFSRNDFVVILEFDLAFVHKILLMQEF